MGRAKRKSDCHTVSALWIHTVRIRLYALLIHRCSNLSGGTFCTTVSLEDVARAIGEYAFVSSELPVVLSLEVTLGFEQHQTQRRLGTTPCCLPACACVLLLLES